MDGCMIGRMAGQGDESMDGWTDGWQNPHLSFARSAPIAEKGSCIKDPYLLILYRVILKKVSFGFLDSLKEEKNLLQNVKT